MTVETPAGRLPAGEERVSTPAGGARTKARLGGWPGAAADLLGTAVV